MRIHLVSQLILIALLVVSSSARSVFCPQCGAENEPGARYCGSCGAELPQQEAPAELPQPDAPAVVPPPPAPVFIPPSVPAYQPWERPLRKSSFGVFGALGTWKYQDSSEWENKLIWGIGLSYRSSAGPGVRFRIDALYRQLRGQFEYDDWYYGWHSYRIKDRVDGVAVPLGVEVSGTNPAYVGLGFVPTYWFREQITDGYWDESESDDVQVLDTGVQLTLGAELSPKRAGPVVEARIRYVFKRFFLEDSDDTEPELLEADTMIGFYW